MVVNKTEENIEKVVSALRKRYNEKGSNFLFKSKHLAEELSFTSQKIGHTIVCAIEQGHPIKHHRQANSGIHVWQTAFKEKSND